MSITEHESEQETRQAEQPPQVAPQQRGAVVQRLYRALIAHELLTRSTLSAEARLSGGVLGNVIEDLRWRGVLLTPDSPEPGLRGPKTRYKLKADHGRVLAIGFGHDRLGVAVTDLSGEIAGKRDYVDDQPEPGSVEGDPTGALERAAKHALAFLDEVGEKKERLVGVGVSLPAPLMKRSRLDDGGRLYAGFMDAWQPRDVSAELKHLLDLPDHCPVVLENDANLIALREHRRGAARGVSHACVVKWGAGLGAGLIIDDAVYEGARGLAGEIGHVKATAWLGDVNQETAGLFNVPEDERACTRCAQPCLEALISGSGLVRHLAYKAKLEGRRARFETVKEVIDAALAGDSEAKEAFRQAAHLLGHKLGPIVSALNLQRVVVECFAHSDAFKLVVDGLREGLQHRMTPAAYQQVTVTVAKTKQTGAILGAADLVLDRHLGSWVGRLPLARPEDNGRSPNGTQKSGKGSAAS